jgi:hypothetical protein
MDWIFWGVNRGQQKAKASMAGSSKNALDR